LVFQSLSTQKYIRIVESLHIRSTYPTSVRYLNLRSQSYTDASLWWNHQYRPAFFEIPI